MSASEILKAHLHFPHCIVPSPKYLLRAGHRIVNEEQLKRVLEGCVCKGIVRRITHPNLTGWGSKFRMEIIGSDVAYPFVGVRSGVAENRSPGLRIVACLPRFALR